MPRRPKDLTVDPDATAEGSSGLRRNRFVLPLKWTVIAVFMAMTIPVLLAIIQINYVSSERVFRDHAGHLVERFRNDAIQDILSEFGALESLIGSAAELGSQEPGFFEDDRALSYLFRILRHSETVLNVYVGLEDGSFRQARRIHDPGVPIHGETPPPGALYAYRLVGGTPPLPLLDHYIFLDEDQNQLGEVAATSQYDPRERAWYEDAVSAGTTTITDPEVFWAFGLVGITVAAPYQIDGSLRGVVAADVTLDSFSAYLARHPISPGSVSYLLDRQGRVLAASDGTETYGNDNDVVELPHVTAVDNELVALAYGIRPRDDPDGVYPLSHGGEDYVIGLSGFDEDFAKRWRLFVVTPLADFTEEFSSNNRHMLLLGLVAVLVQLGTIYVLASLVASPLQKLARRVEHIQALEGTDLTPVRSPVREVAVLSRAIETLDVAVQAFARFVPVGLVRQLLHTEQKLDLGGQSRFLTIFFSDVEGFSTIAERIASRDLLARISTLLEVVSKAVHEERGTIDKFIGDGVMAFWGAPALLDDHAWHACVAALRIQRSLEVLNEQWRGEAVPEMRLRIGIHSDAVLVGNVGSRERMSYTVLGDGVNIAARLENMNKIYGTLTCISHDTFREAGDRLCVRPVDEVTVKGRRSRITIYELLGAYGAGAELEPAPEVTDLARSTRSAFDALVNGDHTTALALYRQVLAVHPSDPVAALHVQQLDRRDGPAALGVVGDRP
jgi:adenylate cyclase